MRYLSLRLEWNLWLVGRFDGSLFGGSSRKFNRLFQGIENSHWVTLNLTQKMLGKSPTLLKVPQGSDVRKRDRAESDEEEEKAIESKSTYRESTTTTSSGLTAPSPASTTPPPRRKKRKTSEEKISDPRMIYLFFFEVTCSIEKHRTHY
jgi:hypothetical protein